MGNNRDIYIKLKNHEKGRAYVGSRQTEPRVGKRNETNRIHSSGPVQRGSACVSSEMKLTMVMMVRYKVGSVGKNGIKPLCCKVNDDNNVGGGGNVIVVMLFLVIRW